MYRNLCDVGTVHAFTDDTKYPCNSVPFTNKFLPFGSETPSYYQREYYLPPIEDLSKPTFKPNPNQLHLLEKTAITPPSQDSNMTGYYAEELYGGDNSEKVSRVPPPQTPRSTIPSSSGLRPNHKESESLLPVLDCRFNMREICKQSILLEDHLSQENKRCHDCCIKHFLAIEGLSEEAITLDKEGKYTKILKNIPDKIRGIQKLWYTSPDINAHEASQRLREIRKEFQQKVFPMVFDEQEGCSSGACKIKK